MIRSPSLSTGRTQRASDLLPIVDQVKLFTGHIQSGVPYLEEIQTEASARRSCLPPLELQKKMIGRVREENRAWASTSELTLALFSPPKDLLGFACEVPRGSARWEPEDGNTSTVQLCRGWG